MTESCLLDFLSSHRLGGILPGFPLRDDQPDLSQLQCRKCDGQGWYFHENSASVVHCQIKSRVKRVSELAESFQKTWGRPLKLSEMTNRPLPIFFVRWMEAFLAGKEKKGRAVASEDAGKQPSHFWDLALASIWRFGVNAYVLKMPQPDITSILEVKDLASHQASLVFVEGIGKLWMADAAFDFETIVSCCEKAGYPLWLELAGKAIDSHAKKGGASARRNPFSRKIEHLKKGPQLDWLPTDCRSRLGGLCQGLEGFSHKVNATKSQKNGRIDR